MKKLIICLVLICVTSSCLVVTTEKNLTESLEYAYFNGQVDALQGDIRVDTITFMWTKSPWNNEDIPIFMYGKTRLGILAEQEMLLENKINK